MSELHNRSEDKPGLPKTDFDIVIIGAGMVGITQALLLAKANPAWRIALIDRQELSPSDAPIQPSFDARATALAAGTQQVFDALGVWPNLVEHACPIDTVHISDKGHFFGNQITASEFDLEAVGYVVENRYLGRALIDKLAQSSIQCFGQVEVDQLLPKANGYQLCLNNDTQLTTQLAVIADGADSGLAKQLGLVTDKRSYQQHAMITTIELSEPHRGMAYERFTPSGPMALLPLVSDNPKFNGASRRMAVVWTLPDQQVESLKECSDREFLNRLQAQFGYRAGHFVRAGHRHCYPLSLMLAREQIRSNLVMLGNAAHFLHPVAGQGFNLALRDCLALASTLVEAPEGQLGSLSVLQAYLDRQSADQALTVGFSDQLINVFGSRHCALQVGRQLGLLGLEVVPVAKTLLAKQTMGQALI